MEAQRRYREQTSNNNNKNTKSNSASSASASSSSNLLREENPNDSVLFYPSHNGAAFPVELTPDFPALPYSTRRGAVKSVIHWGQRKLLLSELQMLIEAFEQEDQDQKEEEEKQQHQELSSNSSSPSSSSPTRTIVYVGSAPGNHLAFLDSLFPGQLNWILVDPIKFSPEVTSLKNFTCLNGYFTAKTALSFVADRLVRAECQNLAKVVSFTACGDSTLKTPAESVEQPEEGANLVQGVRAVDHELETSSSSSSSSSSCATSAASGINQQQQLKEKEQKENDVDFLRDRTSGLNLLVSAILRSEASSPSSNKRKNKLFFVSDVRSGSAAVTSETEDPDKQGIEFEKHIENDMKVQMEWVEILRPQFSLLKFRLPYMQLFDPVSKKLLYEHPHKHTEYLAGKVLLPIFTRPTSTECRLLVTERDGGIRRIQYDNSRFENQLFFFNTVLRENVHFQHPVEDASRESYLDHRYDAAAEVLLLSRYLKLIGDGGKKHRQQNQKGGEEEEEIKKLSAAITQSLGKPFSFAASRLNDLALEKAKARGFLAAQEEIVKRCEEKRKKEIWWTNSLRPQETHNNSGDEDEDEEFRNEKKALEDWSWWTQFTKRQQQQQQQQQQRKNQNQQKRK